MSPPRLIVGLTGGIASGKTTVSRLFEELGVPVADADIAAREVVEPGSAGLRAIADAFGAEVIAADGSLDRAALRRRIFSSPEDRRRLDAITHPLIRRRLTQQLETFSAPYAILVAPLLIEAGLTDMVDRILVVDVPEELQIERVMARDGSSRAEAERILSAQTGRRQRLAHADDVIVNAGSAADLAPEVRRLHALYTDLAAQRKN